MSPPPFHDLFALACLFPAALAPLRRDPAPDGVFWGTLGLALLGPIAWSAVQMTETWQTGLSITLWVSIAASMVVYAVLALLERTAWRLAPLLLPYLILLGLMAATIRAEGMGDLVATAPTAWLDLHIAIGVLTYGLLTLAAVTAFAAFLQERALKRKQPDRLTRMLPSVADSERLGGRLLIATEVVLGVGILSGLVVTWFQQGMVLPTDHKSLLSVLAFIAIGGILLLQHTTGVRGRKAARLVLVAYLLLTLGYPGVKFVSEIVLVQ